MRYKKFSQGELDDLQLCVAALERLEGVEFAGSARRLRDLNVDGGAFVIATIDRGTASLIWQMMGMSKDSPKSAYGEVMACPESDLRFMGKLYKVGGLLSTIYWADCNLGFSTAEGCLSVYLGAAAARSIPGAMTAVYDFLAGKQAICHSGEEALQKAA